MTVRSTSAVEGRVRTAGAFAQDNWTPASRVTVNLGVRYDRSLGDIPATDQFDPSFANVIGSYPAVSDVIGFNNVSPRLGVSWKLDDAGKTVVKTSYGRYYARLNTGLFTAIAPGSAVTQTFDWNPSTGKYDTLFNTTDPKHNQTIDPKLSNEYDDQFTSASSASCCRISASTCPTSTSASRISSAASTSAARSRRATSSIRSAAGPDGLQPHQPASAVLVGPTNRDDFRQRYDSVVCRPTSGCRTAGSSRGRISGRCRKASAPARRRATQTGPGHLRRRSESAGQRLRPFPDRQHALDPRFEHRGAAVGHSARDA